MAPRSDSQKSGRDARVTRLLGLASLFCVALIAFRAVYTSTGSYQFLLWNLLLAWIPLWIAMWIGRHWRNRSGPGAFFWLWLLPWLFFYPNAPYLLTDFIHLFDISFYRQEISIWYDFFLLLFCGMGGIFLGFYSMLIPFKLLNRWYGWFQARLFLVVTTFLCAVGLFLGRFLRWNSWDMFVRPFDVLANTLETGRLAFFDMSAFILLFFLFLLFVYEVLIRVTLEKWE